MLRRKKTGNDDESAWPSIEQAIAEAPTPVTVIPPDPAVAEATLARLGVSERSALGALARHTGGLLVDHGWLRILGGGAGLLNLADINGLPTETGVPPGHLIAAMDVLGGIFAVNGGDLPGAPGEVSYFAPDELRWVPLGLGHGAFVAWALGPDLAALFEPLRWPGWQDEVRVLGPDQGLSVYPYPFTAEGKDLAQVSRRPTPMLELVNLWPDLARQLGDPGDGSPGGAAG